MIDIDFDSITNGSGLAAAIQEADISSALDSTITQASEGVETLQNSLSDGCSLLSTVGGMMDKAKDGISEAISSVTEGIGDVAKGIQEKIGDVTNSIGEIIKSVRSVFDEAKAKIAAFASSVTGLVGEAFEAAKSKIADVVGAINSITSQISDAVSAAVSAVTSGLTDIAKGISTSVKNMIAFDCPVAKEVGLKSENETLKSVLNSGSPNEALGNAFAPMGGKLDSVFGTLSSFNADSIDPTNLVEKLRLI